MFIPKPIEVAINIPSGKIAFADDLRFAYPISEHKESPQNAKGPLWQKIITEGYGEAGLFHGYVGNSCPSICRHNGVLIIGNPSHDDKNWESRNDLPGKHVGWICTDLWWYSIADYDDLAAHMHEMGDNISDIRLDGVIKVKPGRYILRHYYPHFSKSRIKHNDGVKIYATLHRSDKEIKPFKLPDEGIAEMLMTHPELSYCCVESDKDHRVTIDRDISKVYHYYEILMHWIVPEAGDIFTRPKFTGDELQDHKLVRRRSMQCRTEAIEEAIKRKSRMEKLKIRRANMSDEERAKEDAKMDILMKEIFRDPKKEVKNI